MLKTRGGGQAGSRRSRRNQGLEVQDVTDSQVASATPLKVKKATVKKVASPKKIKVQTQRRRSSRNKKEVEYVTTVHGEIEDVTPVDDEIEDLPPEAGGVVVEAKADEAEKATSKDDKEDNEIEEEACLNGEEQKEDEEEAANMEEEEVVGDGVSNTQDAEIPSTEGVQLPGDEVKEKKEEDQQRCGEWLNIRMIRLWSHSRTLVNMLDLVQ